MQILLDSIIYLLAILGIILTSITFFEMFTQKRIINNSYRIFTVNNENNKNMEVIVYIENLDENEEKILIDDIKKNKCIKLDETITSVIIQKNKTNFLLK